MFMLLWLWCCCIRVRVISNIVNISKNTILQHTRYFRDICSWKLLQLPASDFQFGGPGRIVQIDESVITKRKLEVGRVVPQKWIFGIYDVVEKKGIIIYVQNRRAATLMKKILEHVKPGSEIWTDEWRGYSSLSKLGGVSPFIHRTVNHSRNFVDPRTGVCTNAVEGY
ncbi:hypothetical protein ANN_24726 [Periplaneta americana]|uniref:ISXO2-like transposase domain-containing protein n=1 Tax=Periplaneta americana TaxID=6978 RepID=A0ABQ8RZJ9_PERAM|nr:hypothetical protein ANN_24726 [Periplaneta americana]